MRHVYNPASSTNTNRSPISQCITMTKPNCVHVNTENLSRTHLYSQRLLIFFIKLGLLGLELGILRVKFNKWPHISADMVGYLLTDCWNGASFGPLLYFIKKGKLSIFFSDCLHYLIKPFIFSAGLDTVICERSFISGGAWNSPNCFWTRSHW